MTQFSLIKHIKRVHKWNELKCYEKAKKVSDSVYLILEYNNNNSDDHRQTSSGSKKQTPTGNQTTNS